MTGAGTGAPSSAHRSETLRQAKRIVVKVGSSSLARPDGHLDERRLRALVTVLAQRAREGTTIVLVSSGAQAAAMGPLGLRQGPKTLALAQAAASVGQGLLIAEYTKAFSHHGFLVGQVLLTAEDVLRRVQHRNAQRALEELFTLGVIPIINENDTVATDEIRFGDNDRLAALVAHLVRADALVLLTDVDALYDKNPKYPDAQRITHVEDLAQTEDLDVGSRGSQLGTGGMVTKIAAASVACSSGIPVLLTSAENARPALEGEEVGTWFQVTGRRLTPRQLWLAHAADVGGQIIIDEGAAQAVTQRNASLLPAGITGAEGRFEQGDVVEVVDVKGTVLARGLSGFSAAQIDQVRGKSMAQIEFDIGGRHAHEAVHRDDLVVITGHGSAG